MFTDFKLLQVNHLPPNTILQYLIKIKPYLMNVQKALQRVGDANAFQLYTAIFVCLKWLVCGVLILGPSYLFMIPTFTCGDQKKVTQVDACNIIESCAIDYPFTLTAKLNLYCQNQYVRDSILSSEYIGSMIGLVLLSILADKIGRKIIIVLTLFACVIGALILAYGGHYKIIPFLYAGVIMMGFGAYSASIVSYTYIAQVNSDKLRQVTTILTSTFWALAEILFYPIIRFYPQWEVFVGALMIAPSLLLILMSYYLIQTPVFLHSKDKSQCLYSLNYIAKFNGKPILKIDELEDHQHNQQKHFQVRDTLLKWKFLLPVIILSIGQICNNGMYYITQFSISQIGQTFEMNMLLIGCLQLLGYIITNIFCQKMSRKLWLIIFLAISGGIGIMFQFVFRNQDSGWNPQKIVETIFIALSRLANTFGFALFSLITTQSFPSSIKTTGTGIVEAFSNLGNMASPFIVTLSGKLGVQSMCIGGIVCAFGAVIMLFARQTLNKQTQKKEQEPLLREITSDMMVNEEVNNQKNRQ